MELHKFVFCLARWKLLTELQPRRDQTYKIARRSATDRVLPKHKTERQRRREANDRHFRLIVLEVAVCRVKFCRRQRDSRKLCGGIIYKHVTGILFRRFWVIELVPGDKTFAWERDELLASGDNERLGTFFKKVRHACPPADVQDAPRRVSSRKISLISFAAGETCLQCCPTGIREEG